MREEIAARDVLGMQHIGRLLAAPALPRHVPMLDKEARLLFPPAVQLMPTIQIMCAKRGQGHSSRWVAACAVGIVRKIF